MVGREGLRLKYQHKTSVCDNSSPFSSQSPTIGCLLSVGCGVYPPEVLKDFNPSLHLFVGKRLNSPFRFKHQVEELIKLLATAVSIVLCAVVSCHF